MKASQLALWEEEVVQEVHHFMRIVHFDGRRYIMDTACPLCQPIFRESDTSVWSAQFVEKNITKCCHIRDKEGE